MKNILLALGNLYFETNYLELETGGKDSLEAGHEYTAPRYETRLGGSAVNFITQARKLGLNVGIIGKTGEDEASTILIHLLERERIGTELIRKSSNVQTNVGVGLVFAHSKQDVQATVGSANQSLSLEDIDLGNKLFDQVNAVYFGGSFKQKKLWPQYPQIFKILREKNIKLFIDPGRVPVDATPNWTHILKEVLPLSSGYFPNDMEIETITGKKDLKEALKIIHSWGSPLTVVKLGSKGCLVKTEKEEFVVKGYKVSAISTIGAGDVFNSSFIFKLLEGKNLSECAKFANAAAAFRVSKNHQGTLKEISNFIKNN